jgi:hypothetical protein
LRFPVNPPPSQLIMAYALAISGFSASVRRHAMSLPILVLLVSTTAFGQQANLSPPPADLPGHIAYLGKQLWGVPLDESAQLTSQIEKLVLDHMGPWLSSHPPGAGSAAQSGAVPYDVKVRRELERVFGELHYPFDARCAAFEKPFGTGDLVGLGYSLGWTEFNRASVVALFQVTGGTAQQVAVTHFVPYVDLQFQLLTPAPSAADQVWFLGYGTRLGKSHPRLSAALYAYDGKTLETLWQKTDIYDGRISFSGDRMTINDLNQDEFEQAVAAHTPVVRHETTYRVGPKGLEVESER